MAQIAGLAPPTSGQGQVDMPKESLFELEQYRKIAQLRDAVLAGTHPAIKIPSELLASTNGPVTAATKAHLAGVETRILPARPEDALPLTSGTSHNPPEPAAQHRAPEINPIFLEKSAHLVRAEFKLQRQRSERSLREEVEQRRPAKHSPPDLATDLDISDVLSKALTRVPAIATSPPVALDATANNDNRSNSFDDDTFYSSQHDTPDLRSSPSHREAPAEAPVSRAAIPELSEEALDDLYAPPSPYVPTATVASVSETRRQAVPNAAAVPPASHTVALVPGLNNYPSGSGSSGSLKPTGHVVQERHLQHEGAADGRSEPRTTRREAATQPLALEAYAEAHPPSPLLRTHDLQPVAPQPSHHLTLPVDSSASNSGIQTAVGTPAQVAALRHEPFSATSPESSPQGGRLPERKKSKKKKRKADRQAAEADAIYIKPEPRSPSPMGAPAYIRPNKRAKHANRPAQASDPRYHSALGPTPVQDSSSYDDVVPAGRSGVPASHSIAQGEPAYSPRVRPAQYQARPISTTVQGGRRHSGGYVDTRGRTAHPGSYSAYQPQAYAVPEPAEVMYDYVEGPDGYARAVSHHFPYEGSRMSLRPETTPYVGIPRPQPQRIYVDSTGREYLEPRRPTVRQSVAPVGYHREPDVVYERVPPRAASRYAEPTHYVDSAPAYGQPVAGFAGPRRVVTQPEYAPQQSGANHPTDYPRRSMMPPDVRMADPLGPEYGTRAASVRRPPPPPPSGPSREYTSPLGYGGGPESRSDIVPGEYGQGIPLQTGQMPAQRYGWEHEPSAAPLGQNVGVQRYYAPPSRAAEEIAFIEEPRGATQEFVYADSGREEVYR